MKVGQIIVQSGCSYPTVADALERLMHAGEASRGTGRRVELTAFPRSTWSAVAAASLELRRPIYFSDASGRDPNPRDLVRRIAAKVPQGWAVGGVLAARHWDPQFDLHGLPRLDLSVHAPDGTYNTGLLEQVDPALRVVGSKSDHVVLALHPILRKESLFEASSKGDLPVVDPVETLLDLQELGLHEQAEDLIRRMLERKRP